MSTFTYTDLQEVDLGKLAAASVDWKTMVAGLEQLRTDVDEGLVPLSDAARWAGTNAGVTKDFVRKAAKEFDDLCREAKSITSILDDAHSELTVIQKRAGEIAAEARRGDPTRMPPDSGLVVTDPGDGTVRVIEAVCTAEGPTQRTRDLMQWYADTLTGLVSHAAEIDASVTRALKKSHGGDPHNAGHASYTSLDEDMVPRATRLAALGDDADPKQRAELRRLWQSLSPQSRAELWNAHRDDLLAAGLLSPTTKRAAPDEGSGKHGAESPGFDERVTREKVRMLAEGADWKGMGDASRHMQHYLDNNGEPLDLPVDKMMHDDEGFQTHIAQTVRDHQDVWREEALAEFHRNGGQPVAIPVQTKNHDYSFPQSTDENWYFAVGSTRSNVTGVVTVVPGPGGEPEVGLDYQANAWDRYNWDEGKAVDIGPLHIPDGQMARLHTTGLAQEYDMQGSSSVKHYDLGSSAPNGGPLPSPDEPGRDGGRTDPGREGTYR
ncbi:hypothetical protein NRF20_11205 [Streptomyces sp. R-74717]|uniref:hypothetical protein n=1 Tax=Streptomyces TaxID=1883 RepID=UPI0037AA9EC9